jgi:hypothetical protein
MIKTYTLNACVESNKIDKKTCVIRDSQRSYRVLKYDEKYVCDNDEKIGLYRSVVFSEPNLELLCFSPPKSLTLDLFCERNPESKMILATKIVEGIMLSLFWDPVIQKWEIASKGSIGGNYWFFRTEYDKSKQTIQKTFRQMFLEALQIESFESALIEELPKGDEKIKFCYNFVLQHPENHIVVPINIPKLYLVSIYGICKESNTATFVSPDTYQCWNVFYSLNNIIKFPEVLNIESSKSLMKERIEEYKNVYCSIQSPYTFPGIMLLNVETGDRACLENPVYTAAKTLRGNHPNLHYQYLCLRRIGKVIDFLNYFPQYKTYFSNFHKQMESFVTNVYESYKSYYIKKEGKQISKRYFAIIYKLHHDVYLPSLHKNSVEKIIMRKSEVQKQLLEFPPTMLFYHLYQ